MEMADNCKNVKIKRFLCVGEKLQKAGFVRKRLFFY